MKKQRVTSMLMFQSTAAAILILSLINTAHAHYVWLERDGEGSAYAYFGEWVDDIREKAGGLLDRIKALRAFLVPALLLCPSTTRRQTREYSLRKGRYSLGGNGVLPPGRQ
jgi:hypothetical protein